VRSKRKSGQRRWQVAKHKTNPFGIKGTARGNEKETQHVKTGKKRRNKMRISKKGRGR
jgi:hypothetical protein